MRHEYSATKGTSKVSNLAKRSPARARTVKMRRMKKTIMNVPDIPPKKAETPNSLVIATYNLWQGRGGVGIYDFIKAHPEVDIWCFQEVRSSLEHTIDDSGSICDMFESLRRTLPNFLPMHAPVLHFSQDTHNCEYPTQYGISMFVRISLPMVEYSQVLVNGHFHDRIFLEEDTKDHVRTIQKMSFEWPDTGRQLTVLNYHGIWEKAPTGLSSKQDNPERIEVATKIRAIIDQSVGSTVIAGDFNLEPDTKSISIIAGNDMQDLIKDYGIKTTRSTLYQKKQFPFADYVFVSKDLKVEDFYVPEVNYSDHLPLITKISFK